MNWTIIVNKKENTVTIFFKRYSEESISSSLKITVPEAYILASNLLQELDRNNPLLAESE